MLKIKFRDGVVFESDEKSMRLALKDILEQLHKSTWIRQENEIVYKKLMAKRAEMITGDSVRTDTLVNFFVDLKRSGLIKIYTKIYTKE